MSLIKKLEKMDKDSGILLITIYIELILLQRYLNQVHFCQF